jgi:hypothetical protein
VKAIEEQRISFLNSTVFHDDPAVDFGFADMYVIVHEEGVAILRCLSQSVEWEGPNFYPLYTSTLFSDRISQKR